MSNKVILKKSLESLDKACIFMSVMTWLIFLATTVAVLGLATREESSGPYSSRSEHPYLLEAVATGFSGYTVFALLLMIIKWCETWINLQWYLLQTQESK